MVPQERIELPVSGLQIRRIASNASEASSIYSGGVGVVSISIPFGTFRFQDGDGGRPASLLQNLAPHLGIDPSTLPINSRLRSPARS